MTFLPNNITGFRNQAGSAGCTNPIATNFNPNASEDDGSCEFAMGCTLPMAQNFDASAVYDDGSCVGDLFFPNMGGVVPSSYQEYMDMYNASIDAQAGTGFGVEVNPLVYGCSDPNAVNYDPNAEADDGSCVIIADESGYNPPSTGTNVGDLLDELADAAGGPTGGASSGSSGGMVTDSGASLEKDPKGKKSKRAKQRFSGFAGRDAEGFFIGASPSQPYVGATGGKRCACKGCGHIQLDVDPYLGMGQFACARCCKQNQPAYRGACGCG